jgi:hypothetical protein
VEALGSLRRPDWSGPADQSRAPQCHKRSPQMTQRRPLPRPPDCSVQVAGIRERFLGEAPTLPQATEVSDELLDGLHTLGR